MKHNLLRKEEDSDPISVVSNLFDIAMVKNPGKENMKIITKEGNKINRYTPSEDQDKKEGKRGKKVGIAYELDNGEIIYVPE